MAFSWLEFCRRHHIPFTETGAHTQRGNIYVRCPFCAHPEGKHRLGLHLESERWGCWVDRSHSSRSAVPLVAALLGCSRAQAEAEVAAGDAFVAGSLADLKARLNSSKDSRPDGGVSVEREFQGFEDFAAASRPPLVYFRRYLEARGFRGKHCAAVAKGYGLKACVSGRDRGRLIVPIHDPRGRLVGWTGRAISTRQELRYLTSSKEATRWLYNHHRVTASKEPGRMLVVVEGPFDALKVDYYGAWDGLRAVAILGLSQDRAGAITEAFDSGCFDRLGILLDFGAQAQAQALARLLIHLRPRILSLPPGRKDPGDLDPSQVRALARDR